MEISWEIVKAGQSEIPKTNYSKNAPELDGNFQRFVSLTSSERHLSPAVSFSLVSNRFFLFSYDDEFYFCIVTWLSFFFLPVIFVTGREEPDTDDQLLVDTNLDGPSPEMERLGIRWNSSDPRSLQPCLETGHDSVQQVSDFSRRMSCKIQFIFAIVTMVLDLRKL